MKQIVFICLMLNIISTTGQTKITRNISNFSTLKVYNGINLELIKSNVQKIEITGEKAEKVKIKNDGYILKVALKLPGIMAKNKVRVKLYFNKNIQTIDANEGATITGKWFKQTELEVKTQEGALVNLVLNTTDLKAKASSGGVLKLSGTAKNQQVDVDFGGIYQGYNMKVSNMSIVKSGSGAKAEINASETLNLKVTFGGSIFYKGTPKVLKKKKIMGGIIEQRN